MRRLSLPLSSTLDKSREDDMENMNSAIQRIADIMGDSEMMDTEKGIRPEDIGEIVGANAGQVNCYPGIPGGGCHPAAYFVSLTSKRYAKGRGHLTFRKAIECLVQHMQGHCIGKTQVAVILCDNWDSAVIDEWRFNIEQIKRHASVEAYLISGRNISPMQI
jgi:hypothetical protein